jgi:repressor LexA
MNVENRPTKKQKELLSFIDGFIKGNGYGPSYREIMRALDYRSVSTVATHVNGLISRGWLIKKDNSARTLEVVAPTESTTVATLAVASTPTAEQEIKAKLDELKSDNEANADAIAALQTTLDLLGYTHDTELA